MSDNNASTSAPPDRPKFSFPKPTGKSTTHSGNCHCGAIRFTFTLSPPLHEYPVISCNCSYCTRAGALLVYPYRENFVLEKPTAAEGGIDADVIGRYGFGDGTASHRFCRKCGSSVFTVCVPDMWEKFVEPGAKEMLPVNLRMVTGLDLDALNLRKVDGWGLRGPEYKLKD
ncbi:Mss4-like protein [Phyllosticta citrichinensis]|uniref:Mss4-like protein n=1 Tax=Phyllosticta citrichinensis TaxID=1130410 RepID=A0ABR1XTB0_9PEZI